MSHGASRGPGVCDSLRRMKRAMTWALLTAIPLGLLVAAAPAPAAPAPDTVAPDTVAPWTLPPAAAGPIQRALGTPEGARLDGRLVLQSATIDRDHVVVRYGLATDGPASFGATLRHPTAATAGTVLTAAFSLHADPVLGDSPAMSALSRKLATLDPQKLWTATEPDRDDGDAYPSEAALNAGLQQLDRAAQHLRFGEREQAVAVLDQLSSDRAVRKTLGLRLVEAWWRVPDRERAINTLSKWRMELRRTPSPSEAWWAKALLGDQLDGKELMASLAEGDSLCKAHLIAGAYDALGRREDGYALMHRALVASDDCLELSAELLDWQLQDSLISEADALSARLLAKYPDAPEIRNPRAQVKMAQGLPEEAVELLEPGAWSSPNSGAVSSLLGAYQRVEDQDWRDRKLAELLARADAPDAPPVAAFYAGVQLHYRGEWARSNTYLVRVADAFAEQPRLHIYLGMNAFNLGDPEEAMKRIVDAESLAAPDPDVYYCRAELNRWKDPKSAAEDLRRYLAQTEGSPTALGKKQARVKRMLELLDACVASGAPIPCVGPWEHPRGHEANMDPPRAGESATAEGAPTGNDEGDGGLPVTAWALAILLGLGLAVAVFRRGRRT